jgi:hypothetical protein
VACSQPTGRTRIGVIESREASASSAMRLSMRPTRSSGCVRRYQTFHVTPYSNRTVARACAASSRRYGSTARSTVRRLTMMPLQQVVTCVVRSRIAQRSEKLLEFALTPRRFGSHPQNPHSLPVYPPQIHMRFPCPCGEGRCMRDLTSIALGGGGGSLLGFSDVIAGALIASESSGARVDMQSTCYRGSVEEPLPSDYVKLT